MMHRNYQIITVNLNLIYLLANPVNAKTNDLMKRTEK